MGKFKGTKTAAEGGFQPFENVTAENYFVLAKACMAQRGRASLIALRPVTVQGVEIPATLERWGAWVGFFDRIGLPMRNAGKQHPWWQVPTDWPHEFAQNRTELEDELAGFGFRDRWIDERADLEHARDNPTPRNVEDIVGWVRRLRDFSKDVVKTMELPTKRKVEDIASGPAPWHDPEASRASAERLAKAMAARDAERGEGFETYGGRDL